MDLTMTDFITFLIQFVCLYWFTKFFITAMLSLMEGKRQAKLADIAKLDEISHRVRVEQHGEVYYWFDVDDGEFLAQGKDIKSIVEIVKSRFPQHVFFITTQEKIYKMHAPNWTLDPLDLKISG